VEDRRPRTKATIHVSLPIILSDAKAFEIIDIQAYATSAPQPPDPIVTMLHWVRIALDGVFSRHSPDKGLAGHAWVSGLRMDAKKMEGGGNRWYICFQPKRKMEIPVNTLPA
jgi:hypothetical protein